ncbi:MAG: PepSY-like domain-containing protein [Flavobacteriaceae bacterium]|nr:PepSY-like domain-containing protein [Candidatus Onthonaster equi]
MKKIFSLLFITMSVMIFAQDQVIRFNQLPQASQNFITSYFGAKHVSAVIMDDDYFSKDYEVILNNGTKIEFDGDGAWKEIDGKRNAIPMGFVPKSISNYVKKSFPNAKIKKIEKKRFKYEVELTNGLDLEFNSKGQFTKIDD